MDAKRADVAGGKPSSASTEGPVLAYAPAAWRARFNREEMVVVGSLATLMLATTLVLARSTHDADPYSDSVVQAALYLGLGPLLIPLWAGWACYVVVLLARKKLEYAWGLLLVPSLLLGMGLSFALYNVAIDYVQETRDLHGARWPVMEKVFSR